MTDTYEAIAERLAEGDRGAIDAVLAVVAAAREMLAFGHEPGCSTAFGPARCDCGHAPMCAAISALDAAVGVGR